MFETFTVQTATEILNNFYDFANERLVHIEAEKPQITIQSKGKRDSYGWFTLGKVWNGGEARYHEINISAEHLARDIYEVGATLIHEMVHYKNASNNIKDVSRNGTYHNKSFKNTAENCGLIITKLPKIGWSGTALNNEGSCVVSEAIGKMILPAKGLIIFREVAQAISKTKKSHIIKHTCPECGYIGRTSKDGVLYCGNCSDEPILMTKELPDEE
ncbi:hypothetical protein EOM81_10985 [bacterium]|nr:hypothetical protein [bacterium]